MLPEVYGSVRAYFDAVSSGAFELRVRLINPADGDDPRWVELPQTKAHYAGININSVDEDAFWDDAQRAAQDSVDIWYPDIPDMEEYDIPNNSYNRERRLRHKVLYLHSGPTYYLRSPPSLIHPQADEITWPSAPSADEVGYRYVMGEREGWGDDRDNHSVDEFAGIGTHVHEIGHLLGFDHPSGAWVGTNPYTSQTTGDSYMSGGETLTVEFGGANLSGWGSMQSGAHGPEMVGDGGSTAEYRSCPNPFNPLFRMDLGWNTRVDITTTTLNQRIEPGPGHFYVIEGVNGQHYLLDFRTVSGFGQYTGWHQFTQSPGLLLWRRMAAGRSINAMLIPADGRSIFDARQRPEQPEPMRMRDANYTYVWQDRLSDPFGAVEQDGPFPPLPGSEHRPTVIQATDLTHLRYVLSGNPIAPARLAFRNIRIHRDALEGDYAEVDIYLNYWAGALERNTTWSGTVYVGGDVTIQEGVTLTINPNTTVRLSGSGDVMASGLDTTKAELVVYGTLIAEGVTFTSADESADDAKWGGLVLYGDPLTHTTSSVVQGCTIEKATTGVHLETVEWTLGGATIGTGNRIRNCDLGLHIKGNSGSLRFDPRGNVIRNNTIEGCRRGLQIERASGTRIEQNLFTGSGPYKIQVWGQRSDNTQIVNNTLHSTGGNRGKGIHFKGGTSGVVRNTIASGFPQGGVVAQAAVSEKAEDVVRVDYYLGHGNGAADLSGTVASTRRALWSDPKFTDDYTLQADSPGLDLGTPGVSGLPAEEGSRIDLGRYGGTERAGKARGRLALEEYFSHGRVSSGWTGAVGTWSGAAAQGTYQVAAHAGGSPRSYQRIDAARYTVETRVRGADGQVLYMQAGQSDSFRVQLSAAQNSVRLFTRDGTGQEVVQGETVGVDGETWYSVRVGVGLEQVSVWVNGANTHTAVPTGAPADGVVGVGSASGTLSISKPEFDCFLLL